MQYAVASGPAMGLRGAWRRIAPPGSARRPTFTRSGRWRETRGRPWPSAPRMRSHDLAGPRVGRAPTFNRSAVRGWWSTWSGARGEGASRASKMRMVRRRCLVHHRPDDGPSGAGADPGQHPGEATALMELRATHGGDTLELAPLASETSEALVDAFLPLDDALRAKVAEHGQGVPRWTHQLLAWWVSSGRLVEGQEPDRGRRWYSRGRSSPEDQHLRQRGWQTLPPIPSRSSPEGSCCLGSRHA